MRRLVLLVCWWPPLAVADEPSIEPALNAAQRREEQLKTVSVRWKATTFIPKGGRMEADLVGLPLPRADQTVESTHSLVLDGGRFRAEHNDPGAHIQVPGAGDYVVAYDGERWFLRHYVNGRDRPAQLMVERPNKVGYEGDATFRPLGLWCRRAAWDSMATTTLPARTVSKQDVDGVACVAVRLGDPTRRSTTTFFLNIGQNYLVSRVRTESAGIVEVTDVDYREQTDGGWVPSGWTTVKTRPGNKLASRVRAEVIELRVNEPVPPETFWLDPLPGETFTDHDAKKTFHVRDDGKLEELDPTGVPVTGSEPPTRRVPDWPGRSLVRFVLLPALAVAIIGGLILRRRRHPPDTPSP